MTKNNDIPLLSAVMRAGDSGRDRAKADANNKFYPHYAEHIEKLIKEIMVEVQTPAQTAKLLGVSVSTLSIWRQRSQGPVYVKYGQKVGYKLGDIYSFLDGRRRTGIDSTAS